jgi:hypothetical protein
MGEPLQYTYYSHHKCATGWAASILRELCFHLGYRFRTAHGPQQYGEAGSLRAWVQQEGVEFLAFTNAESDEAEALPAHLGFHVVRDPRDVLVSGYFSHKNSHPTDNWPELEAHREALQSVSKEEGLLKEIEFSRPFFTAMREWDYDQDHVLELKMENLTQDPDTQFRRVLGHLGLYETGQAAGLLQRGRQYGNRLIYKLHHEVPLPLPRQITKERAIHPDVLDAILEAHRFEKLTGGRSKGKSNPDSHLRKGQPGDWENHFTDRIHRAFETEYGDIVDTLGYK